MYSKEHIEYLKRIKRNKLFIRVMQILIIFVLLSFWEYASRKGIVNSFIASKPSSVIETIINLHKANNLWTHIYVTIYETLISFTIGTVLGFMIATIMWTNKTLAKIIDPYLTIINSLPKVALGPILVIWIGANQKSIITMALLISVIVTIMSVYNGFNQVDKDKIKLMKSFKATPYQIFTKVVFQESLPTFISSLKINISMNLIGIIMGEFLVSKAGIGYLIMYGSQVFNLNLVMSGVVILCIVATILYYAIYSLEKILIKE